MSGAMPSILRNFYDLNSTSHLALNSERCGGKTAVAIFWLELCNICRCTVSLGVVKVKIQTRYLSSTSHTPYGRYHLLLTEHGVVHVCLTVWNFVLEFVHTVYLFLTNLYFRRLLQTGIYDAVRPQ